MGFGGVSENPDITALQDFVRILLTKSGKGHHCKGVELRNVSFKRFLLDSVLRSVNKEGRMEAVDQLKRLLQ